MLQHSFVNPEIQDNSKIGRKTQFFLQTLKISVQHLLLSQNMEDADLCPTQKCGMLIPHMPHCWANWGCRLAPSVFASSVPSIWALDKTLHTEPQFQSKNAAEAAAHQEPQSSNAPLKPNPCKGRAWTAWNRGLCWVELDHSQGLFEARCAATLPQEFTMLSSTCCPSTNPFHVVVKSLEKLSDFKTCAGWIQKPSKNLSPSLEVLFSAVQCHIANFLSKPKAGGLLRLYIWMSHRHEEKKKHSLSPNI